jgi:hypothetical protein
MGLATPLVSQEAAPFDYGAMDRETAEEARAVVTRFRERAQSYVMDTGRDLLAMKERLGHGLFLKWVEAEMGLTPRSAQNAMQAAAQLGAKSETVSHLPPTALYKLAAPSTPSEVREGILSRIEAGEALTPHQIMGEVREAKEATKKRVAAEKEAARRAALSPEARATEDSRVKRRERAGERQARQWEEQRRLAKERHQAEDRDAQIAAQILLDKMGADDAAAFFARFRRISDKVFKRAEDLAHISRAEGAPVTEISARAFERTGQVWGGLAYADDREQVEELAEQIGREGLREPIVVVRSTDPGSSTSYRIVDGGRRYRALVQVLGRQQIPVKIAPLPSTDAGVPHE